jgi:hypothetical protein
MCRVGDFNLSHDSLTSAPALTTLCELPITNPTLHQEISTGKMNTEDDLDDEPTFSIEAPNDSCDIPINIVRSAVMSDGVVSAEGFAIDDKGGIVRTLVAEETEGDEGENASPVELGCGRHAKIGTKKYGAKWEEH